jgi:plasmid stability protein
MATRTTVRLDDDLLAAAKVHAAATGRSLNDLVEAALRQALATGADDSTRQRPALVIFRDGTGPVPGVDLNSSAALLELVGGA